jgi:hypothetical protein
MSEDILNFPEKLYVGTEKLAEWSHEDPPLAFATPYGTDKAFEKRKDSVDGWCGDGKTWDWVTNKETGKSERVSRVIGRKTPVVIDNVLQEGFLVDTVESRYRTNNKWFQITDPRGFQLQISAENLLDILLRGEVSNGKFVGRYIWGRKGAVNWLTRENHQSYQLHIKPVVERKTPIPGDVVNLGTSTIEYLYIGQFYIRTYEEREFSREPPFKLVLSEDGLGWSHWNSKRWQDANSGAESFIVNARVTDEISKKQFVFVRLQNGDDEDEGMEIEAEEGDTYACYPKMPNRVRILREDVDVTSFTKPGTVRYINGGGFGVCALFDTLPEAKAFKADFQTLATLIPKHGYRYEKYNYVFHDVEGVQPGEDEHQRARATNGTRQNGGW